MKFRKLVLCIILSIFALIIPNINAFAAEGDTVTTQESTTGDEQKDTNNVEAAATTEQSEEVILADQTDTEDKKALSENTIEDTKEETEEVTEEDKEDKKDKEKEEKSSDNYTKADLRLLSALIYCEAQGESYNGKLAVGIVVMNRVRSGAFPDTVKGVIYQKYQFSPVRSGALDRALAQYDKGNFTSSSEKECIKAAKAALSGKKVLKINGKEVDFSKYLYFSGRLKGYTCQIGNHQFK
ncbi:cell wall hydrolase [Lachnospiraceae bacterium MD1]|uniref:Cell wall hydrolase n=1 Tax=Variimorphobacter saccharofermentans TaxID=2755051 RepID=A0A839K5J2_9FIRM|nr:cell wall hydrolase [Variimorphobacter saccharofermentans]MBB2184452.1 cell wall hydrolase [Variimorphobacter saccharofermentans]